MDDEKKTCCCGCSQRKKERSPEEYKRLIHRLNRIEGQIRGIRGMVESDAYCPDILVQSAAAGAALNAFNKELLASHIRTCVVEDIRDGKDEVIDELVASIWATSSAIFSAVALAASAARPAPTPTRRARAMTFRPM